MPRNKDANPVPKKYVGRTGVLLATGPSLCEADIEFLRPLHARGDIVMFGLNDSYRICDFLDVFYACDPKWWDCNPDVLKHPCKEKWTQDTKYATKHKDKGILLVSGGSGKGLSVTPHHINYGSNSGFQLLNLALHYGIAKFILLGYNMDVPKGKQQHFFGKHPKPLNQGNNYKGFVGAYKGIDPEHKKMIINCTYPTGLPFVQMPLEKALGEPRSRQPEQSTTEKPAVPRPPDNSIFQGLYGGPRSDGPKPEPIPIRHLAIPAYGG